MTPSNLTFKTRINQEMAKLICHLLLLFLVAIRPMPTWAEQVDLELVLAMDGSGSISADEFVLQLEGTASAFEDPSIKQAILSGPLGKVAVSVMVWSDAAFKKQHMGWHIIDSDEAASKFANQVRTFHTLTTRTAGIGGGGTGIGDGVRFALEMIASNGIDGLRKTIDVSGDGVETDPWFREAIMMPGAKVVANAQKVQINGLPILTVDFPRLDQYYRENVIAGAGSFIVTAQSFEDFGRAIREKLWREISFSISYNNHRPPRTIFASEATGQTTQ